MIKKFLAIGALAIPMMATPIVSYTTTGSFTPGSTSVLTAGGGTVTYLGGGGSVDLGSANPSNATFGTFTTAGFPTLTSLAGATFTLTINQTTPTPDSGTLLGTLSGTIKVNSSNAFVNFSPASITLADNVTYTILQSANGVPLVPPSTDSTGTVSPGSTTIQGQISSPTVPEPGTVGLFGLGLAAVGLIGRRRRA